MSQNPIQTWTDILTAIADRGGSTDIMFQREGEAGPPSGQHHAGGRKAIGIQAQIADRTTLTCSNLPPTWIRALAMRQGSIDESSGNSQWMIPGKNELDTIDRRIRWTLIRAYHDPDLTAQARGFISSTLARANLIRFDVKEIIDAGFKARIYIPGTILDLVHGRGLDLTAGRPDGMHGKD